MITQTNAIDYTRKNFPSAFLDSKISHFQRIPSKIISKEFSLYMGLMSIVHQQENILGHALTQRFEAFGMGQSIEEAQFKCLMEMLEKFSITSTDTIKRHLVRRSMSHPHLDWSLFAPYQSLVVKQMKQDKAHYPCYHVLCEGMISGKKYTVPAECVFPRWNSQIACERHIDEYDGSGIAASLSKNRTYALAHGISEVLERDALMLSWRLRGWPCHIVSESLIDQKIKDYIQLKHLKVELYDVGDPHLIPVIISVLGKKDESEVTIGSSASFDLHQASDKAVTEALMLRDAGRYWSRRGVGDKPKLIAVSYGHIAYGFEHGSQIVNWYRKQALLSRTISRKRKSLSKLLLGCHQVFGYEPLFIDVTEPQLKKDGYFVCRTLIPNAYRKEWRHQKPFLGGVRLLRLTKKGLGLNKKPHPFG